MARPVERKPIRIKLKKVELPKLRLKVRPPRLPVRGLKSAIYTLLIRKVTETHYSHLFDILPQGGHVLDVGIGNGLMLDRFAPRIRARGLRIDGLDVDERYLAECRRRVTRHGLDDLVTCRKQDIVHYLEEARAVPPLVYFSASFMLLPDPHRVLALLRERLGTEGRVLFAHTLLPERNRLLEWVKPKLKFITSVDFGRVQVRDEFLDWMRRAGFALETERRFQPVAGNRHIYFQTFRVAG